MQDFDNFFLPASDFEREKAFYRDGLGLEIKFEFREQGIVGFRVGAGEPALILKDGKKHPNSRPTVWFVVEDVRAEMEKLRERGIAFLSPPFDVRTGLAVEFEDPAGNRLGITDYRK